MSYVYKSLVDYVIVDQYQSRLHMTERARAKVSCIQVKVSHVVVDSGMYSDW